MASNGQQQRASCRPRDEEEEAWKVMEQEMREGGCHRGILAEVYFRLCQQSRYVRPSSFLPSRAYFSSRPFFCLLPRCPFVSTPSGSLLLLFLCVYGTLGFSSRTASRTETRSKEPYCPEGFNGVRSSILIPLGQ